MLMKNKKNRNLSDVGFNLMLSLILSAEACLGVDRNPAPERVLALGSDP